MTTSKEDLLLAAKAAKITLGTITISGVSIYLWNPLKHDADAFELLVALRDYGIEVIVGSGCNVSVAAFENCDAYEAFEDQDPVNATRLAIFRAAVKIGRAMS